MRIEIDDRGKGEIELGDVLVGHNDKCYLVTKNNRAEFPIALIDMGTFREVNGWCNLDAIVHISAGIGIKRIIKSSALVLKEEPSDEF